MSTWVAPQIMAGDNDVWDSARYDIEQEQLDTDEIAREMDDDDMAAVTVVVQRLRAQVHAAQAVTQF